MHQLTTGALPFDGAFPPIDGDFSGALKMTIARMLEKVFFSLWE
jgi:hypothetical protein